MRNPSEEVIRKIPTVIYARKSTSKLGQKETIENQIKICKRKANDLNLEVVDIKTDTATGTDDNNRQEIKDLINGAIEGKYECVIMKGISRFYRDTEHGLGLIKKLDRSNIRVITVEEGFDSFENRTGNKLDTSRITMYLMFAEMESKKLGERIKHTQIEKAYAGEWNQVGSVPLGYIYNKETKKLDVDYSKAKIIKLIFKLYLNGMGMKSIAHYLNGDNEDKLTYPSPKGKMWSQYTIGFMLKNQVYVGDIVFNKRSKNSRPYKNPESLGKTVDDVYIGNDYNDEKDWIIIANTHEAIIERSQFEKVHTILATKAKRKGIKNNVSLLAGIAKCAKCGSGLTFKRGNKDSKGNIKTKSNYYCMDYIKYGNRYCTSHHVGAVELEDFVIDDLIKEMDSRINFKDATSNLKKSNSSSVVQNNIKKIEKDIEQVTRKTEAVLQKNIDGDLSDAQYKLLNTKLSVELDLLINQLEKLKITQEKITQNQSIDDYLVKHFEEVKNIKNLPTEQQRYILLDLISKIVFDDGKIEIEYTF